MDRMVSIGGGGRGVAEWVEGGNGYVALNAIQRYG